MIKRSPVSRALQIGLVLIPTGLILAGALILFNGWLAGQFGTGAEIVPAWNGARAFLVERADPYSKTVMERAQIEIHGRAARAGEYPYALDIPFPLLILFFPLALIPDPLWARAVWMSLSEIGVIALVLLALQLAEWKPKTWFRVLLILASLGSFYSMAAWRDASLSILLTLAVVGAFALLRNQNDEAAGMLLALASFKWEAALLLFIFAVIGVSFSRRWRVFSGYIMVWVALGGVSYLLYPAWGWPYLRSVTANLRADDTHTLSKYLSAWNPDSGANIAILLISILLLILALEWFAALRGNNFRRIVWAGALSLAVTPLIGFSTTFANLAPIAFSFIIALPFAWERWEKQPNLVLILLCLIFFGSPFLIRSQLADKFLADALLYLFPPLSAILSLYWIRWYVVRPPRTWIDSARREIRK